MYMWPPKAETARLLRNCASRHARHADLPSSRASLHTFKREKHVCGVRHAPRKIFLHDGTWWGGTYTK